MLRYVLFWKLALLIWRFLLLEIKCYVWPATGYDNITCFCTAWLFSTVRLLQTSLRLQTSFSNWTIIVPAVLMRITLSSVGQPQKANRVCLRLRKRTKQKRFHQSTKMKEKQVSPGLYRVNLIRFAVYKRQNQTRCDGVSPNADFSKLDTRWSV